MTAPTEGQPSAEAIEAGARADWQRLSPHGMQPDAYDAEPFAYEYRDAARCILTAAWPLLRRQVIAECVAVAEEEAELAVDAGYEHESRGISGVVVTLRALLSAPPAGGPPKEGE